MSTGRRTRPSGASSPRRIARAAALAGIVSTTGLATAAISTTAGANDLGVRTLRPHGQSVLGGTRQPAPRPAAPTSAEPPARREPRDRDRERRIANEERDREQRDILIQQEAVRVQGAKPD